MHSRQFDIKTAFLYGSLDETIYMNQPPGFEDGTKKVAKLQRSIYGLKQSSRAFNSKLCSVLKSLNMTQSKADACLFYRHENKNNLILLATYVDDALVISTDEHSLNKLLKQISNIFEITVAPLTRFLGLQISIDKEHNVCVNQTKYIKSILQRFQMDACRPISVPADNSIYNL